jgi:hypothetical protein
MTTTNHFTVNNNLNKSVVVYTTITNVNPDSPSTNPEDYIPVYTHMGTISANGSKDFQTDEAIARVVVVRESDQLPVKVSVAAEWDPGSQTFSVESTDEEVGESSWHFYQNYASQPYNPVSLQFNELVSDNASDPSTLDDKTTTFFNTNGYPGVDYAIFTSVAYWAQNQLYAFPGTYYCYEPVSSTEGFILPKTKTGTIVIQNGTATYTPINGAPVSLNYYNSQLTSPGATPNNGIYLTSLIRNLVWEGKSAADITWAFVGTSSGDQMIAQDYQNPALPWYAIAYDMVYDVYFSVQLYMAINAAADLFKAGGKSVKWIAENASKMADSVRNWLNKTGDTAGPDSAIGDDADPVNVDIDTDTDIDIDVDIDVDIDIDVDVDVDIDVDVDVDFGVVVDVDVDVDIDIDVDVDEQTDVDIDTDVDVDIDTDVNVQPGAVTGLLSKVGNWIMTKAFPTLIEGAVIYVAFQSVNKVLNAWKDQDEKDMQNLQPRQTTGLGVLINYMFNTSVSIQERWDTFSDYISESKADTTTLEMNVATILGTGNTTADKELKSWRWSTNDEQAAVKAMKSGSDDAAAFQNLAKYQYKGKVLPLKVGAGVAMKYLKGK